MQENDVKFIEFARQLTPQPIEKRQGVSSDKYVWWGLDNLYPNFLLKLYGEVPLHASIITSKVDYIKGDGLVLKADGNVANFDISIIDSLEELTNKLIFDYVLFNFFCVEVQYNLFGKPFRFNHIPAHHLRFNKSRTKFDMCEDWANKKELLSYDRWTPGKNSDGKSKIFFYTGYIPSVNNVYPDIKYKSGITSMVTDMLVNEFNKNNLEDGFSAAHIISFFKGIPTQAEAREFEQKFAERYAGSTGLKYIINYNNSEAEKSVAIDSVGSNDFADKLVELNKKVETNILTSHQATSPLLFGIKEEGQLGGSTEVETAYEMFKNIWVKSNRNIVECGLNKMFMDAGFPQIEFKDKTTLFSATLEPATKEKVLTIDELRAIDGRPALPNGEGNVLISSTAKASNTEAPVDTNTFDEVDPSQEKKKNGRKLIEQDFDQIAHLGLNRSEYHLLGSSKLKRSVKTGLKFDDDGDLEDYLMKNNLKGKSLSDIADLIKKDLGIDISVGDLTDKISRLTDAGILETTISDNGVVKDLKPTATAPKRTVEIMYDYQVKEGFGEALISSSRGFCVKLIENDRLYTREDIQTMSEIFGYDVFKHSGGWYNNPDTGVNENQCRHEWVMQRVVKKVSND